MELHLSCINPLIHSFLIYCNYFGSNHQPPYIVLGVEDFWILCFMITRHQWVNIRMIMQRVFRIKDIIYTYVYRPYYELDNYIYFVWCTTAKKKWVHFSSTFSSPLCLHSPLNGYLGLHINSLGYICIYKLTIIAPDNGLSPGRRPAIIWTNAGILLIWPLGNKLPWNLIQN